MKKVQNLVQDKAKGTEVTFGAVTVRVHAPDVELIKRNIIEGQEALKRAHEVLVMPGVKLRRAKGKPIYFASPDSLEVIIREIDGVRALGKFVAGRFKVIKEAASSGKRSPSKRASKLAAAVKHT